jgi:hypothetical protein
MYENTEVVEKVYCKDCKWCSKIKTTDGREKIHCNNIYNLRIDIMENFYEKIEITHFLQKPEEINKKNNCKLYKFKILAEI